MGAWLDRETILIVIGNESRVNRINRIDRLEFNDTNGPLVIYLSSLVFID